MEKNKIINVRVTEDEKNIIKVLSKKQGLKVSQYILQKVLYTNNEIDPKDITNPEDIF